MLLTLITDDFYDPPGALPYILELSVDRLVGQSLINIKPSAVHSLSSNDLIRLLKKFPNLVQHAVAPREYTRSKVNVKLLD